MIEIKRHIDESELTLRKQLVERVASSPQFTSSPKLRSFLLYVVDCARREHADGATEQQIGVRIFGRRPGYSSGEDNIVRAQARLLRQKLSFYFAESGIDEPIVIDIPKGQYLPVFRERSAGGLVGGGANAIDQILGVPYSDDGDKHPRSVVQPGKQEPFFWSSCRNGKFVAVVLLVFALGLIAGALSYRVSSAAEAKKAHPFWSPFLTKSKPTLVIYSNPVFRGSPAEGLYLEDPGIENTDKGAVDDTYTGTGEVAAVQEITRLFDAHNASFELKRSQLVTWDQARAANLIFVGAPSQNTALHDLPTLTEFSIVLDSMKRGHVANLHPHPGEPSAFPANDRSQDTAIVALLPGLESGTHILILSGLTTIGTQSAVEWACNPKSLSSLISQVGMSQGELHPFEAVLNVKLSKGVGVTTELAVVHPR